MTTIQDRELGPSAFAYWEGRQAPWAQRAERIFRKVARRELFPSDENARAFCSDLYAGDPVAERFVDEVFFGEIGHKRGREMVTQALAHGIDSVPDAPESMRALFAEFEEIPDWVDPEMIEQGAAIWRRWGTMLFAVAGCTTLEIYTESAVALPLSLTGGYAGDNALRRFLETAKFWIDVAEPGALLQAGTDARATSMLVRIMHVSVRRRVKDHPEWDSERWGLPISQAYMELTLIGGSVAPALALWTLGYQTTPKEMRALLHYQRYLGHILGVRPSWYPTTVLESVQMLMMTIASRSYDSAPHDAELIESFPRSFDPTEKDKGLRRLRMFYNSRIYAAYSALWMSPITRKKYDMPRAFPWSLILIARFPLITAMETLRRVIPGATVALEKVNRRHAKNWLAAQMRDRQAEFDASSALRR